MPTLVIPGTEDAYIPPAEGEAMHRAIAGSTLVNIPGGGHASNVDSAAAFNEAIGTSWIFSFPCKKSRSRPTNSSRPSRI